MLQDRPRCWTCREVIDYNPIFVAICEHEQCPTVCMHGICVMSFRENAEQRRQQMDRFVQTHRAYLVIEEIDDADAV